MLCWDVFGPLSSGRAKQHQSARFLVLLLWPRAYGHRMRRPCPSDWRTLRLDGFRRRPLVRSPSLRTRHLQGSIRFAAFLCVISWLPNLGPAFASKRNQFDAEGRGQKSYRPRPNVEALEAERVVMTDPPSLAPTIPFSALSSIILWDATGRALPLIGYFQFGKSEMPFRFSTSMIVSLSVGITTVA